MSGHGEPPAPAAPRAAGTTTSPSSSSSSSAASSSNESHGAQVMPFRRAAVQQGHPGPMLLRFARRLACCGLRRTVVTIRYISFPTLPPAPLSPFRVAGAISDGFSDAAAGHVTKLVECGGPPAGNYIYEMDLLGGDGQR